MNAWLLSCPQATAELPTAGLPNKRALFSTRLRLLKNSLKDRPKVWKGMHWSDGHGRYVVKFGEPNHRDGALRLGASAVCRRGSGTDRHIRGTLTLIPLYQTTASSSSSMLVLVTLTLLMQSLSMAGQAVPKGSAEYDEISTIHSGHFGSSAPVLQAPSNLNSTS